MVLNNEKAILMEVLGKKSKLYIRALYLGPLKKITFTLYPLVDDNFTENIFILYFYEIDIN